MKSWDAATREDYEERAAIMQFCGKLPRDVAERTARAAIEQRLKTPAPVQQSFSETDDDAGRFFSSMHRLYGG